MSTKTPVLSTKTPVLSTKTPDFSLPKKTPKAVFQKLSKKLPITI